MNITRAGETKLIKGTIFTNVLLADEVNRTPPRTQSALLEAMAERAVTIEGRVHRLPDPFLVIATQNPYKQEGVFPLPESNLDRFLFKIYIDYLRHRERSPDAAAAAHRRHAGHARRDPAAARGRRPRRDSSSSSTRPRCPRRSPGSSSASCDAPGARRRDARRELARGDPPDERDEGPRAPRGPACASRSRTCSRWRRSC